MPSTNSRSGEISGNGVEEVSDTVSESTPSVTAELEPGTYHHYRTVPGREDAGMDSTPTVE